MHTAHISCIFQLLNYIPSTDLLKTWKTIQNKEEEKYLFAKRINSMLIQHSIAHIVYVIC